MKMFLIAVFTCYSVVALSQAIPVASVEGSVKEIKLEDVGKHLGEKVKVNGKVFGSHASDKVTLILLGAPYPNSPLTVVIFAKDRNKFEPTVEGYLERINAVIVTGVLKFYKGKIAIEVKDPVQLVRLVDEEILSK